MNATSVRRGQPLWALGCLLLCWLGVRSALFELPPGLRATTSGTVAIEDVLASTDQPKTPDRLRHMTTPARTFAYAPPSLPRRAVEPGERPRPLDPLMPSRAQAAVGSARHLAGHNLLWMAAMSAIPLPAEVPDTFIGGRLSPSPQPRPSTARQASRWGGDGWLVWRTGAQRLGGVAANTPVYGASQFGAVLRYHLAPASSLRPAAYVRAVRSLEVRNEGDLAAGVALRPLPGLAVTAHAEARVTRRGAAQTVRPAAFLSGGVDAAPIGAGLTARGYAQAGYVGGRDGTAFADGSLIAEKPLWRERDITFSGGAGAWGGAQRGSARLDIGPSASLGFRLGDGSARISADYRIRVAGNAEPANGAAISLSAGF